MAMPIWLRALLWRWSGAHELIQIKHNAMETAMRDRDGLLARNGRLEGWVKNYMKQRMELQDQLAKAELVVAEVVRFSAWISGPEVRSVEHTPLCGCQFCALKRCAEAYTSSLDKGDSKGDGSKDSGEAQTRGSKTESSSPGPDPRD